NEIAPPWINGGCVVCSTKLHAQHRGDPLAEFEMNRFFVFRFSRPRGIDEYGPWFVGVSCHVQASGFLGFCVVMDTGSLAGKVSSSPWSSSSSFSVPVFWGCW